MKNIKVFHWHIRNCFHAFKLRRIVSGMMGRSIFQDLKDLIRDICRGPEKQKIPESSERFLDNAVVKPAKPDSRMLLGGSGCGRTRYNFTITPGFPPSPKMDK